MKSGVTQCEVYVHDMYVVCMYVHMYMIHVLYMYVYLPVRACVPVAHDVYMTCYLYL